MSKPMTPAEIKAAAAKKKRERERRQQEAKRRAAEAKYNQDMKLQRQMEGF